ncbi:glycosyltransferase [Umezawaea sp.]|uniref:glycosyltransferase n=1 Tax=Umezawaea sp. TaxID=1955258 RepID=UPI002ED12184
MGKRGVLGAGLVAAAAVVRAANTVAVWRGVPRLPDVGDPVSGVTAVVAARDEEATLDACLTALRGQVGRVVVVDDASTDGTADVARRHGVALVSSDGPPPGWAGKVHAMHLGALEADGEWLLFVDADVVVAPGFVGHLLAAARVHQAALVSSAGRSTRSGPGYWLLLPPTNQLLFESTSPSGRPGRRALGVGHCMLVSREAYDHAGGWSAIAATRADDVGLATLVRDSGARTQYVDAGAELTTSGHDTVAKSWRSLRKSTFAGINELVDGPAAVCAVLAASGVAHIAYGLAPVAAVAGRSRAVRALGVLGWLGQAVAHLAYVRRVGQPRATALLAPAAPVALGLVMLDSAARAWRGVTWKGRDVSG